MDKHINWIIVVCVALTGGGCASHRPKTAAEGQAVFAALQQAVAVVGAKAKPSLVLVKVEKRGSVPEKRTIGSITFLSGGSSDNSPTSGIILTKGGHILVPGVIKPDRDDRITVLIGADEFVARAIKVDETLGMTILKLDSDETFNPLDISTGADLAPGEWAVVLKSTDEDADFQKLTTLAVSQGEKVGAYRRFMLSPSLVASPGALVLNLSGQVVGLVDRSSVLAINDIREDLQRFIADATDAGSSDDEKQKKGWFGVIVEPINKEYALARKLSPSSIWVMHALADGPGAAAGLRDGDLIIALGGKPLRLTGARALDYFNKSLHPRAGDKFAVTVLRDNKPVELVGTFAKAPEPITLRAEDLGVTVSDITDSEVFSQNLAVDRGVLVTDVYRGSPAANSGSLRQTLISKRDVIVELAGQPTPTVAAFSKVLESIRLDHPPVVLVKYYRGLLTGYAGLNLALGEKDNGDKQ